MKKLPLLSILGLFFVPYYSFAQEMPSLPKQDAPPSETIILPPPQIRIPENMKALEIAELNVNIEVAANIAVTKYDITFFNPNNRILEGEFDFAMTLEQSVRAFALDVDGKMRDGVIVEKTKARQVFEEIVNRRVDPGLLEKTADNHFKARIYPINPNGTRRIQIILEEKLNIDGNNYFYKIPLNFDSVIGSFSLKAEIIKTSLEPSVKENSLENFKFSKWNDSYNASFNAKNYKLSGNLSFAVPVENNEKIFTASKDGKTYFFALVPVAKTETKKNSFKKIAILQDASNSAANGNKSRELEFLDNYFKNESVQVQFVTFSIKASRVKNFTVKNGNWDDLKKEMENVIYDGGTNLKALENINLDADAVFLFSDGLDSFGQSVSTDFKIPVFAINSSNSFSAEFLNKIAVNSGGLFINLAERSAMSAADLVKNVPYKLLNVKYDPSEFEEVFPSMPVVTYGKVSVSGIVKKDGAKFVLQFGTDKIQNEQTLEIKNAHKNDLAENVWVQDKIRELSLDSLTNKDEIVTLSKKYGILTDFTSLLVLEDINDYVNNEITPPAELLEQYNKLLAQKRRTLISKEKDIIANALEEFKKLKSWWEKDFPKDKPPVWERNRSDDMMISEEGLMEMESAAPASAKQSAKMKSVGAPAPEKFMEASHDSKDNSSNDKKEKSVSMQIQAWESKAPYMEIIKKADKKDYYKTYLEIKKDNNNRPSFFLDMSTFFQQNGSNEEAVLIISNISEMKIDDPDLLKVTAQKLLELGALDFAISLFKYVTELRPEVPQSYRDLAFAQSENGQYQQALDNYYKIITGDWQNIYNNIKTVVFVEMNRLIAIYGKKIDISRIDSRFIFSMPVEVRMVLSWSAPNIYIDLHVVDPYNETCAYNHNLTYTGGKMSLDITSGYGPQEYMIKTAIDGTYSTYLNYYGGSSQKLLGPVTAYADIYTFYGTPYETHNRKIVRLDTISDKTELVDIIFDSSKRKNAEKTKTKEEIKKPEDDKKTGIVDTKKNFFK
ncbi:MAG: DUF2135 domain-containing protein [Endomicrobia bacterium]|nr:DUF2135 domain-containing protein [Endomicrobiia bacterium]